MSLKVEELAREIGAAVSRATFSQNGAGATELRLTEDDLTGILTDACALAVSIALGEPPPKSCASLLQTSNAASRTN